MNCFLLSGELAQPLEDGVDVTGVPAEIEDPVELDPAGDRLVRANELAEVMLLLVGLQRVPLHEPVRLVSRQAGLDQCEQEPLAEEEATCPFEVASHSLGPD